MKDILSLYAMLSQVIIWQVLPGRDEHVNICFEFHPSEYLIGTSSEGATLLGKACTIDSERMVIEN